MIVGHSESFTVDKMFVIPMFICSVPYGSLRLKKMGPETISEAEEYGMRLREIEVDKGPWLKFRYSIPWQ